MKVGHAVHVERDEREIGWLSVEKGDDRVDGALNLRRRWHLVRAGSSLREPRTRLILSVLRELNRNDAAVAPGKAAHTNRRMEERKASQRHGRQPVCMMSAVAVLGNAAREETQLSERLPRPDLAARRAAGSAPHSSACICRGG